MIQFVKLIKAFGVTRNTLRNWIADYSNYLSEYASPPKKGMTREFTISDAQVLSLVAAMRRDNAPFEEIDAALSSGERGLWPVEPPRKRTHYDEDEADSMQLVTQLTARASSLEGQLTAVAIERDRLLTELESVRREALDAEIRAAGAESEARILKELAAAAPDTRGFWARLRGK